VTEISAALVKQLRDRTGAGMMECKRALQETGGDIDGAVKLLREKGMASAGKKADRGTSEGLVGVITQNGAGAIVGIGCETDFVAKNPELEAFGEKVLRAVFDEGPDAASQFEQDRVSLVASLGENIVVVDPARFEGGTIGAYVHPPANKIGVLVQLEGGTPELSRQLAMHISFGRPEWVTREDVPAETVEAERRIYLNSDEVQSKPEAAREKIVDGMLAKRFYAATPGGVLVDQAWIHDQSQTVGQALNEAGASVTAFALVSVAGS
jgi:elongation factor Ts